MNGERALLLLGAIVGVAATISGLLVGLGIALLVFAATANAHDWMPQHMRYCCSDKDCLPYPREAVEHTKDGWVIKRTGQVFPDNSPDVHPNPRPDIGEVFICHPSWQPKARCILVLPEGS